MECSSDVENAIIRWKYCKPNKANSFKLLNCSYDRIRNSIKEIVNTESTAGSSTKQRRALQIPETNLEHAGIYECIISIPESDSAAKRSFYAAELVVLGR